MGLWSRFVLPRVVRFVCGRRPHVRQREAIVPLAEGRVLEIGFGSGLSLPYYARDRVTHVWGLDPSGESLRLAEDRIALSGIEVALLEAGAEAIPLESKEVDTVVVMWSLCTIGDRMAALAEMRRVLAPGGRLLFCEHGAAPDESVRKWQDRVNPVWTLFSGGCELNLDIPALLREGGFAIERLESMYLPGLRLAGFNYRGVAR